VDTLCVRVGHAARASHGAADAQRLASSHESMMHTSMSIDTGYYCYGCICPRTLSTSHTRILTLLKLRVYRFSAASSSTCSDMLTSATKVTDDNVYQSA
jgi:hypothetical protein